jgi:hypothetical protein
MAKVLSSISFDAPASPVEANVDDTFAFSGTPGFTGTGGVQRYDYKWEVDDGGGYVTIGASGTGLITADTNPVINSNGTAQKSITVSCESAGTYTIRMVGAPTSGGSYTVASSTESVTVSEPAVPVEVLPGVGALVFAGFAAVVSVTANVSVLPGVGELIFTGFAPTVTVGAPTEVLPGTGEIVIAGFAPVVSVSDNQNIQPGFGELVLAGFAPTVTVTNHQTVLPGTGEITLAGFAPTVTATENREVLPGLGELVFTGFAPTVTASGGTVINPLLSFLGIPIPRFRRQRRKRGRR